MVESNPAYKHNNSANRIISKEEEREDIQGEILQSSNTVFPHIIQHCSYMQSSHPVQRKLFYIQN